jgi:ubiquinone/menaquinone biosynthesis C-methylase UbiE
MTPCNNERLTLHQQSNGMQRDHWERIYHTKKTEELSWTQEVPRTSMDLIHQLPLSKTASVIDIGGGESKLADFLLEEGFENISVLDISDSALERAKKRLGNKADNVKWIVADITGFNADKRFDLWHDRAVFHFLTSADQIASYISIARKLVRDNGFLIIGTFSDKGPEKCSGLPVRQYTEASLTTAFSEGFEKISCIREEHITPFGTNQQFVFCLFRKK